MRRSGLAFVCFLAASCMMALPADAQPVASGPYVSGSIGYLQLRDRDFDSSGLSGSAEYDGGVAANLAFGYRIGAPLSAFRIELEVGYAESEVDELDIDGFGSSSVSGDVNIYTALVNAFVDVPVSTAFQLYAGVGLGLVYYDADDASVSVGGTTVTTNGDSETEFAAMAEVGVSYFIQPNLAIVPAYRFLWIDNEQGGFDSDAAHIVKLGLRYHF